MDLMTKPSRMQSKVIRGGIMMGNRLEDEAASSGWSSGEIVRAQGEAHLGEDALHVLRLEMFGHLAGVEDVIDVLDYRLLDELRVGEEEDAIRTQSGYNQDAISKQS